MGSKLFKRLGIAITGIAMAVGVGFAIGNNRDVKVAEAANHPTGTKIIKVSQIESGKKYYIGATLTVNSAEVDYYFCANGASTGDVNGTPSTTSSGAAIFLVTGSVVGDTGTFSFKFDGTSNYLSNSSSSGKVGVSGSSENWTVTQSSNLLVMTNSAGRVLQRNSTAGTNRFCCYASGQTNVWLQPAVDNSDQDYSINCNSWSTALATSSNTDSFSNTATSKIVGLGTTKNVTFGGSSIYKTAPATIIKSGTGYLYNTSTFDSNDIKSITVMYAGTAASSKIGVYFGTTSSDVSVYTSSKNATNTGQFTIQKFENNTSGIKYFQISASTANLQLISIVVTTGTIESYTLDGTLSVSGTPSITSYYVNQTFNPKGLTIKESYNSGAYIPDTNIADSVTWSSLVVGASTSVTGSYTNAELEEASCTISGLNVSAYPTGETVHNIGLNFTSTNSNFVSVNGDYSELIFANNPVTFTATTNTGTTAAGNYHGGGSDEKGNKSQTRLYKDNEVQISCGNSYELGNISITCESGHAAGFAGGSQTNCTISVSGSTVNIYPVPGSHSISFTLSAGVYFTSLTMDVFGDEIAAIPVESVSLNTNSKSIMVYEQFSLTATVLPVNADDVTVTWTSSSDAIATVVNGVVTGVSAGNATITVETNGTNSSGNKLTATCTVTVSAYSATHTKVTNVNQLHNGAKVILAASDGSAVAKAWNNSDTNLKAGSAIFKDDKSTLHNTNGGEFTIWEVDTENHKWVLSENDWYLSAINGNDSSKRALKDNIKIQDSCLLSISITDGVAEVKPYSDSNSVIKYNSTNSIFNSYASGQNDISLYVNTTSALSDSDYVSAFIDVFMKMNTIDEEDQGTGLCTSNGYYSYAKSAYQGFSEDQIIEFCLAGTYDDAVLRLSYWADANGDVFDFSDTGTISAKNSIRNSVIADSEKSNSIIIIATISIVSALTIGGYFFIRRRKEQ